MEDMRQMLTEELAGQVTGGKLTNEAQDWLQRNVREIYTRAAENGKASNIGSVLASCVGFESEYSLESLKVVLSMFISVEGLN